MKKILPALLTLITITACTSSNTDKAVTLVEAAMSCNVEKVKSISPSMSEMFSLGCNPKEIKEKLTAKSFGNIGSNEQELIGVYQGDKLFACVQTIKDSEHLAPHKKLSVCKKAEQNASKSS